MSRFLFVLPEYPPDHGGGIATYYGALLPALAALGHRVDVLVGSAFVSNEPDYERDGVRVSSVDRDSVLGIAAGFPQYVALPGLRLALAAGWALHERADAGRGYDLVEVTDWGLSFVPWVVQAEAPVTVQLHGSSGQIDLREPDPALALEGHVTRLLEAALLRSADCLRTHSQANRWEWSAITGREVELAPPPLPARPDEAGEDERRGEWGVVVGRIQEWKGPLVLCEALRRLGKDAPQIRWVGRDVAAGRHGRSMSEYLRQQYPDIWGSAVEPIGQVTPAEVVRFQSRAAFAVVPSTWDVCNLAAAEAMRAGTPVVCSRGAGISDFVTDGLNGLTFPSGDAEALADRLATIRTMPRERLRALGAAARETAAATFAPATVAARLADAYAAVRKRDDLSPDPWAAAAASPDFSAVATAGGVGGSLAFLHRQPLRDLAEYVLRRAGRRFAPWVRS